MVFWKYSLLPDLVLGEAKDEEEEKEEKEAGPIRASCIDRLRARLVRELKAIIFGFRGR